MQRGQTRCMNMIPFAICRSVLLVSIYTHLSKRSHHCFTSSKLLAWQSLSLDRLLHALDAFVFPMPHVKHIQSHHCMSSFLVENHTRVDPLIEIPFELKSPLLTHGARSIPSSHRFNSANCLLSTSLPSRSSSSQSPAMLSIALLLKPPDLRPGISSHKSSNPSLINVRRFCSLLMWFSRFCSSDRFSREALTPLAPGFRFFAVALPWPDSLDGGGSAYWLSAFGFRLPLSLGNGFSSSSSSNGGLSLAFLLFRLFLGGASGSSSLIDGVGGGSGGERAVGCRSTIGLPAWALDGLLGRVVAALLLTSKPSSSFSCSRCIDSTVSLLASGVYPCTALKFESVPNWKSGDTSLLAACRLPGPTYIQSSPELSGI